LRDDTIIKELVYEDEVEFERLIPKVKKLVRVRKNGSPVIFDSVRLTQDELIMAYLTGRFFAEKLGFVDKNTSTNKEISEALRLDEHILAARLSDLIKRGFIERSARGEHRIVLVNLEKFLDEFLKKPKRGLK
jgi:hypothetical protein